MPVFNSLVHATSSATGNINLTETQSPDVSSITPISNVASPSVTPTNPPVVTFSTPGSKEPILIGHSIAGRPLHVYQFGYGAIERMVIAGIHGGNEYNTILLAEELIRHYQQHPAQIPGDVTLYILPALNPDGAARSNDIYGRANDNNVDLNHNFPVNWQAEWSRDGCWRYLYLTGGSYPASEPETQALMNFLQIHHVDALISYHSPALGIFPGGDPPDPDSVSLAIAVASVSDYPYPPIYTGCMMTGSLADWAVSQGIAAIDLELTDHTHTDFNQNIYVVSILLTWSNK